MKAAIQTWFGLLLIISEKYKKIYKVPECENIITKNIRK